MTELGDEQIDEHLFDRTLATKLRLSVLSTLEESVEKLIMAEFRYKMLPKIKKEIAKNLMAEIYEDDKQFTINISFGGDKDE